MTSSSFLLSRPLFASVLFGTAIALSLAASGCSGDAFDGIDDEGDDEGSSTSAITGSGRWSPPNVKPTGTYSGSGSWNGGKGCTGGMLPGTQTLRTKISKAFKTSVDGYACRPNTADTSKVSMHGTGRALDIFATGSSGTKIADYLVNNHQALGIQLVIWSRAKWNVQLGGGSYSGPNPHTDHIHAELTPSSASSASKPEIDPNGGTSDDKGGGGGGGGGGVDDKDPTDNAPDQKEPGTGSSSGSGSGMLGKACGSSHGFCNPGNNGSGLMCRNGVCVVGCVDSFYCPGSQVCSAGQCR